MTDTTASRAMRAALAALLISASGLAHAQSVPIIQPGAPGKASKVLTAEQATKLAEASYTASDVAFMQHMILHHQQALDMAVLVKDRTKPRSWSTSLAASRRQADEIGFMKDWLSSPASLRKIPDEGPWRAHAPQMKGMASPDQMKALLLPRCEFDPIPDPDDRPSRRPVDMSKSCSTRMAPPRSRPVPVCQRHRHRTDRRDRADGQAAGRPFRRSSIRPCRRFDNAAKRSSI